MSRSTFTRRTLLAAATGTVTAACGNVLAQPVRRLIVPFGSGAVIDTIARAFSNELGKEVGSAVIVESRAGAGGSIGTASVARGPADGTTLLVTSSSHHIAAALHPKLPFDAARDFTGVAYIGAVGYALMVSSTLNAKTVAEFVQAARAAPSRLNYASAGNGSNSHLAMAGLCESTGLQMTHVPTRSTGDALLELLSGRVHAVILSTIGVIGLQSDARVRILATTGKARNRYLPNVPTLAEGGVQGFSFDSWAGLLAPAGTPKAEVQKLNTAMRKVLANPEVVARLDRVGVEVGPMSLEGFQDFLAADVVAMNALVKAVKLKVD